MARLGWKGNFCTARLLVSFICDCSSKTKARFRINWHYTQIGLKWQLVLVAKEGWSGADYTCICLLAATLDPQEITATFTYYCQSLIKLAVKLATCVNSTMWPTSQIQNTQSRHAEHTHIWILNLKQPFRFSTFPSTQNTLDDLQPLRKCFLKRAGKKYCKVVMCMRENK